VTEKKRQVVISDRKLKSIRNIISLFLVLLLLFVLLLCRCLYLQLFKSRYYSKISAGQQGRLIQKPQRGTIVDCQGRVLAASNKIQTVFADPLIIKQPEKISVRLAALLDMDAVEIYRLISTGRNRRYVKIKRGVSKKVCEQAGKIRGIGVQSQWQRYYPTGRLACHVVGITGSDDKGLEGIELRYDDQLGGAAGHEIFYTDGSSQRRFVRLKQHGSSLTQGKGIILTIDAAIQHFARSELLRQYENVQAESAVAIVAEPQTGAVLAMVSVPDFEPNNVRFADANSLRNRAIWETFEPGSLLKPVAAAIALDEGVVDTKEKIFCEHGNYRGKGFGRIGEYGEHRFGELTVREIIVHSSNIGMAKIGQRTGKEQLYRGLRLFGFGRKTGVELPGEAKGLVRPAEQWTGYSVTRIPFGQEISVTAIQLVRAFCILANGGKVVQPYIVKAVVDGSGEIIEQKRPGNSVGFVVKSQVAEWIVREAMTGAVNEGTGTKGRLKKWQVFGKTGTANIANLETGGYSDSDYVASFAGGAPAQQPQVVVLVSIRKPDIKLGKGYTGGRIAAPVAAKIIAKTLNYLEKTTQGR